MAGKDNLTPWQPGQSGNPNGRQPGSKNWATIVQDLLNDPDLAESVLEEKPGWWDKLPNKNMHEAISVAMIIKSAGGDTKAATWLRKTAYGDKIDLVSDGQPVKTVSLFDMRAGMKMQMVPADEPKPPRKSASKKVARASKAKKAVKKAKKPASKSPTAPPPVK